MNGNFGALAGHPAIIGGGLAGLMTALRLAPHPVVLLSKAPLGEEASTPWAQGGLAASLGEDDDPALHLADTLGAGDGLCDAEASGRILRAAPAQRSTELQLELFHLAWRPLTADGALCAPQAMAPAGSSCACLLRRRAQLPRLRLSRV